MASELKGKGLEVVLIDFRENPELVRRTVKERGYTAPVLLDKTRCPSRCVAPRCVLPCSYRAP